MWFEQLAFWALQADHFGSDVPSTTTSATKADIAHEQEQEQESTHNILHFVQLRYCFA